MEDLIENRGVDTVVVHPKVDGLLITVPSGVQPVKDVLSKE